MPKVTTEQFINLLRESIQKGTELSSMRTEIPSNLRVAKDQLGNWDLINKELLIKDYYYDHNRYFEIYTKTIRGIGIAVIPSTPKSFEQERVDFHNAVTKRTNTLKGILDAEQKLNPPVKNQPISTEKLTTTNMKITDKSQIRIFVAMAFDDSLADTRREIKNIAKGLGLKEPFLVDEQEGGTFSIPQVIRENIEACHIFIADLTHSRPNVYYELGYAEALRKQIILLAKKDTEPHFDVKVNKIQFYSSMVTLESLLKSDLQAIIDKLISA